MGFNQKGSLMFRVARAAGQWVVTEDGSEKPLASLDARIDALEQEDIAMTRRGSQVRVFDETGHELPGHTKAGRSH